MSQPIADIASLSLVTDGSNALHIGGPTYIDRTNDGAWVVVIFDDGTGASSLMWVAAGLSVPPPLPQVEADKGRYS